jgi:hypothetical protein
MATSRPAFTLIEAVRQSPSLAQLLAQAQTAQGYLNCVAPLMPTTLRAAIAAGPIEDGNWCLVVKGNAVAAKLRQMLPRLIAHLQALGHPVNSIRLKVVSQ